MQSLFIHSIKFEKTKKTSSEHTQLTKIKLWKKAALIEYKSTLMSLESHLIVMLCNMLVRPSLLPKQRTEKRRSQHCILPQRTVVCCCINVHNIMYLTVKDDFFPPLHFSTKTGLDCGYTYPRSHARTNRNTHCLGGRGAWMFDCCTLTKNSLFLICFTVSPPDYSTAREMYKTNQKNISSLGTE